MFARVCTFRGGGPRFDEGVALFRDQVVPEDEKQPGFEGALLLANPACEVSYAITFWRSEEDLAATRDLGWRLAEMTAHELEVEVAVASFEVAFANLPALVA